MAKRPAGRPPKWASGLGDEFVAAVEAVGTERGILFAIRTVKKRNPKKWGAYTDGTLETRYHKHQQRVVTDRRVAEILWRLDAGDRVAEILRRVKPGNPPDDK